MALHPDIRPACFDKFGCSETICVPSITVEGAMQGLSDVRILPPDTEVEYAAKLARARTFCAGCARRPDFEAMIARAEQAGRAHFAK